MLDTLCKGMDQVARNKGKLDPIGELFKGAWGIYRKRFWALFSIIIVPVVLFRIIDFVFTQPSVLPLFFVSLVNALGSVAMVFSIYKNAGFIESYRYALRSFWPLLLIVVLIFVMLVLGVIAFIVPALILYVWFMFYVYIFVVEDRRDVTVIAQSREYVRGYWWPIFGRILPWLILIVVAYELSIHLFGKQLYLIPLSVFNVFISPLIVSYSYKLYENMTILKPDLNAVSLSIFR